MSHQDYLSYQWLVENSGLECNDCKVYGNSHICYFLALCCKREEEGEGFFFDCRYVWAIPLSKSPKDFMIADTPAPHLYLSHKS